MASTNKKAVTREKTHEGGPVVKGSTLQELKRLVSTCMLWEGTFYVDGIDIADRICWLSENVEPQEAMEVALEAKHKQKLRHAPMWIARALARKRVKGVDQLITELIVRADEIAEFLAMYWTPNRVPITKAVKRGLNNAFLKFDEYQFAKWNRDKDIKLRDVMFLTHPKPESKEQKELFSKIANDILEIPNTWEVRLSRGESKKDVFEELIMTKRIGALAMLRNLRNMTEAGVERDIIKTGIKNINPGKILPFQFISAGKFAPAYVGELEEKMLECLQSYRSRDGYTIVLVDVSGSMGWQVSSRSILDRRDCAIGVAIHAREVFNNVEVWTFSEEVNIMPNYRGFALGDHIKAQTMGGTYIGSAVARANEEKPDRIIVITDEQSHDAVGAPHGRGYMVNIATYDKGVGFGKWVRINGWSESVIDYILETERCSE